MNFKIKGDKVIMLIVILLGMVSILSVFSAGSYLVRNADGGMSKVAIYWEQARSVMGGIILLIISYSVPLGAYRKLAPIVFGVSLVMLLMLYIPAFRDIRNGAVRGIKIGRLTFQVFELAKVGLVLFMAWSIETFNDKMESFKDYFLKLLVWIIAVCLLILPNSVSSALLIAVISFLIMFFMGIKWQHLTITATLAVGAVALLFFVYHLALSFSPEKTEKIKLFNRFGTAESRIMTFVSGTKDTVIDLSTLSRAELNRIDQENRQSDNAKIAIAEGGIFGKGPGRSTQRFSLSMAFSDFIFAFIVEESGLIGGIFVIMLYLIFLFRCIAISYRCRALFSQTLVLGLSFLIATQAFLHILVNVRLLPITGHTLPLVSHGGTAYFVLSIAFGMILSVSRTLDDQREAANAAADLESEAIANAAKQNDEDYEDEDYY